MDRLRSAGISIRDPSNQRRAHVPDAGTEPAEALDPIEALAELLVMALCDVLDRCVLGSEPRFGSVGGIDAERAVGGR